MIIPDLNLLLYAYDTTSPFHKKSVEWWQDCLSGEEPVGIPGLVALGFVRIATHPRVFWTPMPASQASANVRSWLEQPVVRILEPAPGHLAHVLDLLESLGTAGNLVTDAQLAAFAVENDAVLHTADADFLRFPGVRWLNPLTGVRSPRRTAP